MRYLTRTRTVGCALTLALSLQALSGCAAFRRSNAHVDPGYRGADPVVPTSLPALVAPEPLRIPNLPGPVKPANNVQSSYRRLNEAECIQAAARASTVGRLLDAKARSLAQADHEAKCHSTDDPSIPDRRAEILHVASLEARNLAALTGLEGFYRLEEAVALREVVEASQATIRSAEQERERLVEKGLSVPPSIDLICRRKFETAIKKSEAEQAIEQLSIALDDQLKLSPGGGGGRIWPVVESAAAAPEIDIEREVQLGMSRRPEVALLHRLDRMQSDETIRALRETLSEVNPLLTLAASESRGHCQALLLKLCGGTADAADLDALRAQWDIYRQDREREIAREIREAGVAARASAVRLRIAVDRLRQADADLHEAQDAEELGAAGAAGRGQAELGRLEALAACWKQTAEWQIAVARLRRTQYALLP